MRKFMIALAASGAAFVAATPASAQYYPQPQPGYGAPYGNAYGYNQGYGNVRALQSRVNRIERDLIRLARVRAISPNEYNNREGERRDIERRLRRDFRDGRGLDGGEIMQIERRIARDTRDGNRWGYNGYNGQYMDRDRDGRNDRYEDDRGYRRD